MRTIARFLLHILANALAILAADWLVPHVVFKYDFLVLIKVALILGLVNFFLKPILKVLATPLIILSLGLFSIIINLFLIWLVTYIAPELIIQGFNAFFWTMVIVVIFNFVISVAIKEHS